MVNEERPCKNWCKICVDAKDCEYCFDCNLALEAAEDATWD